ncbi:hypothetical protein LZ32DRAFT_592108 [Colletotrichum eremochloae]|nr:hypothetical protein LZ32DRAFT_592108 [Colletotrichum eremochloae]
MGDHDDSPTCVSAEHHGPTTNSPGAITDLTAHYFGCIKISERADFLDRYKNAQLWDHELHIEMERLFQQGNMHEKQCEDEAIKNVDKKIKDLAFKIDSQYKRTEILREALSKDPCLSCTTQDKPSKSPPCNLVSLAKDSHEEWKKSDTYKEGINTIREWRQRKNGNDNTRSGSNGSDHTASDIEDVNRKQVRNIMKEYHPDIESAFEKEEDISYELERDTNGYIIQWDAPSLYESNSGSEKYLKPVSESATDYRFKGQFPDQRTTLKDLLLYTSAKEESKQEKVRDVILSRKRHKEAPRVRYIHIPHNNMKVRMRTRSQMVLRPEYWRGQQHGGGQTLVHARHMRAICERISSNIWEVEDNPDNIVLFMPFLHWEEDRKRDKIASIIEQETVSNREEREKDRNKAKNERVSERTYSTVWGDKKLLKAKPQLSFQQPEEGDKKHARKIKSTWEEKSPGRPDGKHSRNFVEHGRLQTQNKLGQFLLDAARLYEAISMYRDQKLVETFLHHDPPLHPRRTLDQSYYWALNSTKFRDRDQVVYRGTTMDHRDIHRLKVQDDCKGQRHTWHLSKVLDCHLLNRKKCSSPEAPEEREAESSRGFYKWDGHLLNASDVVCDHCRGEIRKVSRIVMVDQLWMWILDKQTIITSFPKRYGTNKSDPSGVHNSIRTRIKNARKNQIRSVFDVALIILDECSNTFFDRTKTKDRQPQVLDIFAESIGNLQNKQTVSCQHLWHWTEGASKIYNSKSKYEDTAHLPIAPLLNINPEGKLQREIRDIIDELDIMIHVIKKQKEVIKRFVKNVENIYDPSGTWRDETPSPDGERNYLRSRSMSRTDDDPRSKERNRKTKSKEDEQKLWREKEEFTWFRKQAYDLISDVEDRINELEGLRKSAESTSQGVWPARSPGKKSLTS